MSYLFILSLSIYFSGCDDEDSSTSDMPMAGETTAGEATAGETDAGMEGGEVAGETGGDTVNQEMATAAFTVADYGTGANLPGATVCNTAIEACAETNEDGVAEISYVVGESALFTVDLDLYFGAQLDAQLTPNEDGSPNAMGVAIVGRAAAELVVGTAPETIDVTNDQVGHIVVWSTTATGTFLPGASFSMDPASGKGPYYFADGNIVNNVLSGSAYAPEADSTSGNGFAQIYEIEPGEYSITISTEGRTCTASYGLPNGDNSATFSVAADRLSYIQFTCDGPEPYQTAVNLFDYATGAPLEGATVCNVELDTCVDTDAEGATRVPYLRFADNTFTFTKENYFTANVAYTATENLVSDFIDGIDQISTTMIMRAQVDVIVPQAPGMPSVDPEKSGIVATTFDRQGNPISGVSVTLNPASGEGPFYFAEGNLLENATSGSAFNTEATATTSSGVLTYINVDPGSYTLSFSHDTLTCVSGAGLSAEGDNIRLQTVADALTYFTVYCFDLTGMQPANIQILDGSTSSPVEGASVCPMADVEGAECYTTDSDGMATIMYEPGVSHVATAAADGFMTARASYNITPEPDGTIATLGQGILGKSVIETLVTQADGVDMMDDTKGQLAILAANGLGSQVAGVAFEVSPMSGIGPQYFAEGDLLINAVTGMAYDPEATETTSNGFANVINMEPGEYTLTATHATATCTAIQGVQNEDGTISFDMAADQLTFVRLICTE